MTFMMNTQCSQCHLMKYLVVNGGPHLCEDCLKLNAEEKKRKYFEELDKLTPEERMRRIEEWIYEYKPKYVPPPLLR